MQDRIIRKIVNRVKHYEPYKSLYRNLKSEFKISDLPLLSEKDIRKFDFEHIPSNSESVCVYFTTGTTSEPKAIYYNSEEIEYISDYIRWFCEMEGAIGGEKVAVLLDQSFWGVGYFTVEGHRKAGNVVVPIDSGLSQQTIVDLINIFQPTVISSIPSFLMGLKKLLPDTRVRLIETTGEIMDPEIRKELEEHFGAEIFDAYGLTEGVIGTECSAHDGYHFLPDKVFLEIIDLESDSIVGKDQWGELVMTTLCNAVMPMIRYRTGDICKITDQMCLCGSPYPRVWVRGRKKKTVPLYEGAKVGYKELQDVIFRVFDREDVPDFNVNNNERGTVIEIIARSIDGEKMRVLRSNIKNINYETLYLYQTGKLHIVFKKQ